MEPHHQERSDVIAINGAILRDRRLTPTEKIVYARIAFFKEYFESAEAAAEFLGLRPRAVQVAKCKLEKLGYIICTANTGRGKRYIADIELGLVENPVENSGRLQKNCEQSAEILQSERRNSAIRTQKFCNIDKKEIRRRIEINNNVIENNTVLDKSNPNQMSELAKPARTCVSGEAEKLAKLLNKRIIENKPNRKINKNWLDSWSKDIDKLHRIDGRTWEEIERAIEWSQTSEFWRTNILSGAKLREKIDTLEDQMNRSNPPRILQL